MYEWHEVFFIKPDLVLVNYSRKANYKLIKRCKSLDIAVAVLDTEGGILRDANDYFRKAMKYARDVDMYFTWGKKQYNAVLDQNKIIKNNILMTGCPRYDYGFKPWKNIYKNNVNQKNYILFNTNFPFVNPSYNTPQNELEKLIHEEGYEKNYAFDLFEQTEKTFDEFIKVIRKITSDFPDLDFIVRPHPFESIKPYEILAEKQKNLKAIKEGSVFLWLAQCNLLIHQNCSTAVESILSGVEPLNLKFISGSLLKQPVSENVSINITSYKQLHKYVTKISNNEKINVPIPIKEFRKKIIEDWFYKSDGLASLRVAEKIESIVNQKVINRNQYSLIRMYLLTLKNRDYIKFIYQLVFQVFGAIGLMKIKKVLSPFFGKQINKNKYFSLFMINDIVSQLSKVDKIKFNYSINYYSGNKFSSILFKKY